MSADTNLFLYAANPRSPNYADARKFFADQANGSNRFFLCGLVLVEIYMQLRNPAVFSVTRTPAEAALFCDRLRKNPNWEFCDCEPIVAIPMCQWAATTSGCFRQIIDARLAFTLRHHGVTHFATANVEHVSDFVEQLSSIALVAKKWFLVDSRSN